MYFTEDLQRLAGRTCLMVVGGLGMMGYHYANVRFLPLMAGFAIFAGVCYFGRTGSEGRCLRHSGPHSPV
jgi:hypothetical protein